MLHPNKRQWVVIWVATVLALLVWLGDSVSPYTGDPSGDRVAVSIVVIGLLLVWRLSEPKPPQKPQ